MEAAELARTRKSCVVRDTGLLITVISNTSHGAWPILRVIDEALGLNAG
ncbi:MAG: hypothetical protein HND57_01520 [Planctomycetes bacterium]|nr:hypothetical protein [Planctomycetota bacterium]